MKSLRANVTPAPDGDRRAARRWQVDVLATLPPGCGQRHARVRNLSEGGMMLETDADLDVGDILSVNLEGVLGAEARIVWRKQQGYGCHFLEPIESAAISTAILKAPVELPDDVAAEPSFEEIPIGVRPTMDDLAAWKLEFERRHASQGMRLVAFRQTEGGLLIAIAAAD